MQIYTWPHSLQIIKYKNELNSIMHHNIVWLGEEVLLYKIMLKIWGDIKFNQKTTGAHFRLFKIE